MVIEAGAIAFGVVIGWVTHRTLRRNTASVGLGDIASVLGAVGGGVVVTRFTTPDSFSYYAIGLAFGFFLYLWLASTVLKDNAWLSSE